MDIDLDTIDVINNPEDSRYEAHVGEYMAVIKYYITGERIVYMHTGVPRPLERQGLASKMAKTALDDARAEGLKVVPICPFVAGYIERNPEYQDLVYQRDGD